MTNIQKLTELQHNIGYTEGFISPVAVLGLAGEVGEVLDELIPYTDRFGLEDDQIDEVVGISVKMGERLKTLTLTAAQLDKTKKVLRDSPSLCKRFEFIPRNFHNLELEASDVLYYLMAICNGLGITLDELAGVSYRKVMAKRQAIGPEFTGRPETN